LRHYSRAMRPRSTDTPLLLNLDSQKLTSPSALAHTVPDLPNKRHSP
jgi:hypothetical protein